MKKLIYFLPVIFLFAACVDQSIQEEKQILDYLADNNLTAEATSEGIYYIIENEGTGERPVFNSTVEVDYHGYLLDGTVFDSSYDRGTPATFGLWRVIPGWQIGIPLFKEGGKGTLIIPSSYAYGSSSPSSLIPRNAILIFDIELHDVE